MSIINNQIDSEINVENIMARIRENILLNKKNDILSTDTHMVCSVSDNSLNQSRDISYINSNCNIFNSSYFISSHHSYIGKVLIKGRELVHGEVRRYVDPSLLKQSEWNASSARIIKEQTENIRLLESKYTELESKYTELESKYTELESKYTELELKFENYLKTDVIKHVALHLESRISDLESTLSKFSEKN